LKSSGPKTDSCGKEDSTAKGDGRVSQTSAITIVIIDP
jgi:hypothetical protein